MLYLFPETWSSGNRQEQPLDKTTQTIIRKNWKALTNGIELYSGLVDKLYAGDYLSKRQRDIILGQQLETQKIEKLLEILLRRSLAAFDAFVRCLVETEQGHVRRLLDGTAGNSMLTFYDVMMPRSVR